MTPELPSIVKMAATNVDKNNRTLYMSRQKKMFDLLQPFGPIEFFGH